MTKSALVVLSLIGSWVYKGSYLLKCVVFIWALWEGRGKGYGMVSFGQSPKEQQHFFVKPPLKQSSTRILGTWFLKQKFYLSYFLKGDTLANDFHSQDGLTWDPWNIRCASVSLHYKCEGGNIKPTESATSQLRNMFLELRAEAVIAWDVWQCKSYFIVLSLRLFFLQISHHSDFLCW